jgi:hypothetical protein
LAGKRGNNYSKHNAQLHRQRMGDPAPIKPKRGSGMSVAEVVRSEEIAVLLEWWLKMAHASYDEDPLDSLAEKIGMDEAHLRRIVGRKMKYVTLQSADKILVGIGRQDALANGEATVVPNPMWSQEHYIAYMQERGCI